MILLFLCFLFFPAGPVSSFVVPLWGFFLKFHCLTCFSRLSSALFFFFCCLCPPPLLLCVPPSMSPFQFFSALSYTPTLVSEPRTLSPFYPLPVWVRRTILVRQSVFVLKCLINYGWAPHAVAKWFFYLGTCTFLTL